MHEQSTVQSSPGIRGLAGRYAFCGSQQSFGLTMRLTRLPRATSSRASGQNPSVQKNLAAAERIRNVPPRANSPSKRPFLRSTHLKTQKISFSTQVYNPFHNLLSDLFPPHLPHRNMITKTWCCHRGNLSSVVTFLLLFTICPTRAQQECAYLPPGGPLAFGLHEVSRYDRVTPAGDSPLWMDDGRIIIGSSQNSGGGYRRGAVYVFSPYTSRFDFQSIIYPPIPEIGAFGSFGLRLATSGSWIAVGAKKSNDQNIICMFEATGTRELVFRTTLVGTGASGERLGDAPRGFAMHGRWLAAIRYGNSDGRIFLYRVNDIGGWETRQEITHPVYQESIPNGTKIDLHGRTLLVTDEGTNRADVWYLDDNDVWNWETRLVPQSDTSGSRMGEGMDAHEDRIFLGAPDFEKTTTRSGGIFIFRRLNGQWVEEPAITASSLPFAQFIGAEVSYSKLGGEYLATCSGREVGLFQPNENGIGWKRISRGQPGRLFRQWESPGGHFEDYGYAGGTAPFKTLTTRGYQVLGGFSTYATLHEHGVHSIQTLKFSGDPECKRRPVYYVPIGAPRDETDTPAADLDGDGTSDITEIYFSTFLDTTNQISSGMTATVTPGGERTVRWQKNADALLWVKGKAEWSSDLLNWTSEGITETNLGQDPDGREIVEIKLPASTKNTYIRLNLTVEQPPEQ